MKKRPNHFWLNCSSFWCEKRDSAPAMQACGTAAVPLFAKKVLQALLQNAQTLSGSSPIELNMKKQPNHFRLSCSLSLVREEGLEPSWTFSHPQEPESCASANFAILANRLFKFIMWFAFCQEIPAKKGKTYLQPDYGSRAGRCGARFGEPALLFCSQCRNKPAHKAFGAFVLVWPVFC